MGQETTHNLFSNFQSTVYRAIKAFLNKNKEGEETDQLITTSLRIPAVIKEFYEFLAEAETTSFNTAIVSTLSKVKDHTITEYLKSYTKINDAYDYQLNSFLKIIDAYKIDYNDLCSLLELITDNKVSRVDITNKEKLINLIDKEVQLKFCKIFGYNYDWIKDNRNYIFYKWPGFEDRWYKNVISFVHNLIMNFYLDETVESFGLSFLCSDRNVINNIISGNIPAIEENITPIVIAKRCLNGIKVQTYHRFESNNINYEKCRSHFVVLIKMILMLNRHNVIDFPNGYAITPQQHDMIQDGSMHLVELFNKKRLTNNFCLDDLEDIQPYSLASDKSNRTDKPNIMHSLNISVIHNIIDWSDKKSTSIALTDDLASKCGMNKKKLTKYLRLFDKNYLHTTKDGVFMPSGDDSTLTINLVRIREIEAEHKENKILDTSFG